MNTIQARSAGKAVAVVAAAALMLTTASCGGDSDSSADDGPVKVPAAAGGSEPSTASSNVPAVLSSDPASRASVATVKRFYKAMREKDAAAACAELSIAQRRQTYPGESCLRTYRHLLSVDGERPGFQRRWTIRPTYSASSGQHAVVKIQVAGKDYVAVPIVKQGGKWKLGVG